MAEAVALLEDLVKIRLLSRDELETKDELINCYRLNDHAALVPLLCTALWLIASDWGNSNCTPRMSPVLRGEKWKEKES